MAKRIVIDRDSDQFRRLASRKLDLEGRAAIEGVKIKLLSEQDTDLSREQFMNWLAKADLQKIDPVQLTKKLVRTPSVVGSHGERVLSKALGQSLSKLLPKAEVTVDRHGNVIATLKPIQEIMRDQDPIVLFSSHMDVVPADANDSLYSFSGVRLPATRVTEGEPPQKTMELSEQIEVLYGRGASDMKAGLAVALCIFRDLYLDGPEKLTVQPMLVIDTKEESSKVEEKGFYHFAEDSKGTYRPQIKFMVNFEPAVRDGQQCCATLSSGRCLYRIRLPAEGENVDATIDVIAGKSAHTSTPDQGENPLDKIAPEQRKNIVSLEFGIRQENPGNGSPDITTTQTNRTPDIAVVGLAGNGGRTSVRLPKTPVQFVFDLQQELDEQNRIHTSGDDADIPYKSTFTIVSGKTTKEGYEIIVDVRNKGDLASTRIDSIIAAVTERARKKSGQDARPEVTALSKSDPHICKGKTLKTLVDAHNIPYYSHATRTATVETDKPVAVTLN